MTGTPNKKTLEALYAGQDHTLFVAHLSSAKVRMLFGTETAFTAHDRSRPPFAAR
jgi:hypothetical protein